MEKILLFIPMYNCEKQIIRVLDKIDKEVLKYVNQVLIVNNRSTDEGEKTVGEWITKNKKKVNATLLRNDENYGLGGSHKVAFDYAMKNKYDYVIIMHGDDQGDIHDLLPYLESGEYKKHDCMLGARFIKGSKLVNYSSFRTFGNKVYNLLFSIGTKRKVYDLGSGLNMYSTKMLKDKFYYQFPDNLVFNYCMVMALDYYKQDALFFPISWREEDQVSNVKMFKQATKVLSLLASYVFHKKKFMESEHREKIVKKYTAQVIESSNRDEKQK